MICVWDQGQDNVCLSTFIQHHTNSGQCNQQDCGRKVRYERHSTEKEVQCLVKTDMIAYLENSMEFTKKLLALINKLSKLAGYKIYI